MTDTIQILGTTLFALAVLHTFSIKVFQHLALKFPEGSVQENLFHLLGEVEIVFGLWTAFLVAGIALLASGHWNRVSAAIPDFFSLLNAAVESDNR
ncbi:MAG: hypothetical protein L0387_28175 [Acidobacteria bacterium]|nr:hypothetical protein [Acidobacteriota bacterium]MCI0625478.1 hypothetical protein [Acidobacteriota bacterium]MCI0718553.1 hypothetical protein [Acidobacteriota bacterium]